MLPLPSSRLVWSLAIGCVLACQGEAPPRAPITLLSGVPVMPEATPLTTSAGSDAVEAGYQSAAPADSVAGWYRRWLVGDGWRIAGDVRSPDGTVVLHALKGERPLWLMIQPAGRGSTFSVIGAQADTSARRAPAN